MRGTSRCVSSRKLWFTSAVGVVATLALAGTAWSGEGEAIKKDEVFKATSIVSGIVGKIAAFDISFVDNGQYLLADRTNAVVEQVSTSTNSLIKNIGSFVGVQKSCNIANNDLSGPDGVFTVDHNTIWVGDGPTTLPTYACPANTVTAVPASSTSTVKIYDLSGTLLKTINTGGFFRVDEGCYDPRDHIVLIANDAEHDFAPNWPFVSFIASGSYPDASKQYTILGTITMNGSGGTPKATNGIEQCQWSEDTGKFYLNIPEVNGPGDDSVAGAVLVIDPKTRTIEHTWTISHEFCAGPQGMAIGPRNQILLACNQASGNGKFSTVFINQNSGAITRVLSNESGGDEAWYNPGDEHYFLGRSKALGPSPSGPVAIDSYLGVIDSAGKRADQSVAIGLPAAASHSVAADPVKNQVYVPIPAYTPTTAVPGFKICSGAGAPNDTQGCIAVFTTTNDDHPRGERKGDDND